MTRWRFAPLVAAAAGCAHPAVLGPTATPAATANVPAAATPTVDQRIAYYAGRVEQHPRLYPVWAQLAEAYFDKAKETWNPSWLANAHDAVAHSRAIQDTYHALEIEAQIAAYTHQFTDALTWAHMAEAAATYPPDTHMRAIEVEALVGLGEIDEARQLVPEGAKIDDFFVVASLAKIANEDQRFDQAASYYLVAARLAHQLQAAPLVAWAEAMAGGMYVDAKDYAAALPHLDAARQAGGCAEETIHRGELLAATGKQRAALVLYEQVLSRHPDPHLHHVAFKVAKQLGDEVIAQKHYQAAEQIYRSVIDKHQIYTLNALAQLLLDGNGNAQEALALAHQNIAYKRDRQARVTLDEAERRAAGAARP
jgi:tetratricopeptide (TPR) repeat protein